MAICVSMADVFRKGWWPATISKRIRPRAKRSEPGSGAFPEAARETCTARAHHHPIGVPALLDRRVAGQAAWRGRSP